PRIPVCRQYAPEQPWNEIIPAHPRVPETPRDWLKQQILHLAKDGSKYGSERNIFEFLTGRPMRSSDNYSAWFQQQLAAQDGELSLEQLYTLFIWAHVEWRRPRDRAFSLPVNGSGTQFAMYRETDWSLAADG
ncbi:MAG: hypothetical protein GY803_21565, partial [Chloroflexi bacterium]|nr:hypothetical protein [Chloroflexota bacterium]